MTVIRTDIEDRVAVLTLDRPEARNALNGELLRALPETIARADADPEVDVIVVTGADPAFCAGIDLKELQAGGLDFFRQGGVGRPWARTTKPVIGAVNGPAVTGGLEIALHCDFLVASDRARFADTHARVGLLPGWGLTVLLPQAVGARKAKEMSLTGRWLPADEALLFGLVNKVVSHEELLPTTTAIAREIASGDGRAVRALLASYDRVLAVEPERGFALEAEAARAWNPARAGSTAGLAAVRPDAR
ncbi:MAG: enoyl-CoA hydratase [Actinomycetota bacterium]|nr:enoyl-CoA hydratase [Actinomycetota bacterium]